MEIAKEDIKYFESNGVAYTFMWDEDIYKYFYAGVPIAELARIRGCSESRIKALVKRHKDVFQMQAFHQRLNEQELFDKRLARLDPTGSSQMTMAYLQPLRAFLQSI